MTSSFNIIGVMSGTSVDGLDLCYVSFNKDFLSNYKIICSETIDYPSILKTNLINAINLDDTKLKELDFKLGEFIGFSIEDFLQNNNLIKPGALITLKFSILRFELDFVSSIIDVKSKLPPERPLKKLNSVNNGFVKSE